MDYRNLYVGLSSSDHFIVFFIEFKQFDSFLSTPHKLFVWIVFSIIYPKITYNNIHVWRRYDKTFNGILFFSPSAVRSYCYYNKIEDETLFTIGQTTTNEAKTFSNKIITSDINSIDQVVDNAIKYFTYDKK